MFFNFTLLPLHFRLHPQPYIYISPAWSLALEFHFYLLVPILVRPGALRGVLAAASAILFVVSASGVVESAFWGYRLLPGVLFLFLLGSLLYDLRTSPTTGLRTTCLAAFLVSAVLLVAMIYSKASKLPFPCGVQINVLIGILASLPLVWFLSKFARRPGVDSFLGDLAYGVFLAHPLCILVLAERFASPWIQFLAVSLASVLLAILAHFLVERPLRSLRRRILTQKKAQTIAQAQRECVT